MGYPHFQRIRWEIVAVLLALASMSAEAGSAYAASLPVEEKVIPLTPSITFVKASNVRWTGWSSSAGSRRRHWAGGFRTVTNEFGFTTGGMTCAVRSRRSMG